MNSFAVEKNSRNIFSVQINLHSTVVYYTMVLLQAVFVEQVFRQSMLLISPSCREKLSPKEAVYLYQELYVLQTLLDYNRDVLNLLRSKFMEEFKWVAKNQTSNTVNSALEQLKLELSHNSYKSPRLSIRFSNPKKPSYTKFRMNRTFFLVPRCSSMRSLLYH